MKVAEPRLAALKSIDPKLDLGHGLTIEAYETKITALRKKVEAYNTLLSQLDQDLAQIETDEEDLRDTSERMLAGTGVKYGKNSNEYQMAGGTKKSERKKPKPSAATLQKKAAA